MKPSPTLAAAALCLGLAGHAAAEPAARTLDPGIYGHVVHVGWVVADLDPVLEYWRRLGLRIGEPESVDLSGVVYRGRAVDVAMRVARTTIAGVEIRWIEPRPGGENAYAAFLERHGDGVHHLAYAVPSAERLELELAGFAARGAEAVQRGS